MPETRFLKIVIIALLMINAGTLGYLLMRHPHNGPPPPPRGDEHGRQGAAAFLYQELQLSEAQEQQYRIMREQHHAAVEEIREQMKEQKARMYRQLSATDTTGEAAIVSNCVDSIAAEQRVIERITFGHFRQFRAICNPQQQHRFDEVISDALERL